MNIERATSKLNRFGFKVEKCGNRYIASSEKCRNTIKFMLSYGGGEPFVTAIQVRHPGAVDDIREDYSAGFFVDNISNAIKFAQGRLS
ncbi:MAG: hypothetical protein V3U58_04500 [Thermodesulfobacteriota bacterium]